MCSVKDKHTSNITPARESTNSSTILKVTYELTILQRTRRVTSSGSDIEYVSLRELHGPNSQNSRLEETHCVCKVESRNVLCYILRRREG